MAPTPTITGLLVGRLARRKSVFLWSLIPKSYDAVDVLETSAPTDDSLYLVMNSQRIRRYLRYFVIAAAVRRDSVGATGVIPFGDIREVRQKLPLDLENLGKVDEKATIHSVSYNAIDENFLIDISNILGGGIRHIKRFYSLQVIVPIQFNDEVVKVLVPLQEMFLFLQDSPGMVSKLAILPSYHFAFVVIDDTIPLDTFRDFVVAQATKSATTYINYVDRAAMLEAESGD